MWQIRRPTDATQVEDVAERRQLDGLWLRAREELPATLAFWRRRGYVDTARDGRTLVLGKALWLAAALPTPESTHAFGERMAALLQAGDVVVLTGVLGAGKTTLTRGLGAGLGVRGDVTSPTFVLARVHPALAAGPEFELAGLTPLDISKAQRGYRLHEKTTGGQP